MRAYRAGERERRNTLRGDHSVAELAERVVELTSERDRLWAQVVRLQQRIALLENALAGHPSIDTPTDPPSPATGPQSGLSRAERRRLEREQQHRQRHR
jgi:hypothetical protein